ncbi:MAG: DUF1345 domain-containing protein [Rhodospirillaceae bacterium]|nr:MAG: DUF1345 domain-containing protein [Rhodospirillaceae bacterium]
MALPRILRHFRDRPALIQGIASAVVAGAIAGLKLRLSQAVLVGWCCGVTVYLGLAVRMAVHGSAATIRQRAARLDLGMGFISGVALAAAVASISAIIIDLGQAKTANGLAGLSIALAAATLVLSWMFVQTAFALHYAHSFYRNHQCLCFPNTQEPDYWDFFYFSAVVGMTAQVSDVTTGTAGMRRLVLVHSIISFFYNTAILALGVNLAASLAA